MISIDEQTEILFEIPFHYFLENEEHITKWPSNLSPNIILFSFSLLSVGSSFTAVIDKCRQRGNSTVVLLHFMVSAKVADIRKSMEYVFFGEGVYHACHLKIKYAHTGKIENDFHKVVSSYVGNYFVYGMRWFECWEMSFPGPSSESDLRCTFFRASKSLRTSFMPSK